MKRILVVLAVMLSLAFVVWAREPNRDLDGDASSSVSIATLVDVVNLPLNEDGAVTTSGMIGTRVIDLLPDGGVDIGLTDIWKSESFDTRPFDSIAFQGTLLPDAEAVIDCRIEWQIALEDEFSVLAFNSATNGARGHGITLHSPADVSCDNWDAFSTSAAPCYHRMSVLQPVNGTRARVACKGEYGPEFLGGPPAELISMKVMLRRG